MNYSAQIRKYKNFHWETRNTVQRSSWLTTGIEFWNCRNTMKDRGKPVCIAEIWNKTGQSQSLAVNAGEAWHPFPQHTCCLKALWGLIIIIIMTKVSPKHDFKQLFFFYKDIQNIWNIQDMAWGEQLTIMFLWEGVVSQSICSCVILEFLSLELN